MTSRDYDPIFCACGAQWHGKATASPEIEVHTERWIQRRFDHEHQLCGPITHQQFRKWFNCACAVCRAQRLAERVGMQRTR